MKLGDIFCPVLELCDPNWGGTESAAQTVTNERDVDDDIDRAPECTVHVFKSVGGGGNTLLPSPSKASAKAKKKKKKKKRKKKRTRLIK
jgi:hypothetical protein